MKPLASMERLFRKLIPAHWQRMTAEECELLSERMLQPKMSIDTHGNLHYQDRTSHFIVTGVYQLNRKEKKALGVQPSAEYALWCGRKPDQFYESI